MPPSSWAARSRCSVPRPSCTGCCIRTTHSCRRSSFAVRGFTVTNLATVLLYAAIGVAFFLVAYELQVAAGWSALEAGTALLPATVLMLLFSAKSGELGQRIGPRLQLTLGPLLAAAGLVLLARIGPDASWFPDVLPGAIVFGLGLVTFVAPLTATVMGSVDPNEVSIASGVNNAIARTASLAALSVIPVVSGLSDANRRDVGHGRVSDCAPDRGRHRICRRTSELHRPRGAPERGLGSSRVLLGRWAAPAAGPRKMSGDTRHLNPPR